MKVAIFGMGYVGCVTAVCLADCGHVVAGVDIAPEKVQLLNQGRTPVVEPGLAELVAATVAAGRFTATTDEAEAARDAAIILVTVGTPSDATGAPDLGYLTDVCRAIGTVISEPGGYRTVVVRSTIPPGTCESMVIPLLEDVSGKKHGVDFAVLFVPEFLREASAIADFQNPPLSVIGAQRPEHAEPVRELFGLLAEPTHVVSLSTAESVKYAANAFHAVKVAFSNELARLFAASGADAREAMRIFALDHQLNISERYLRPGFAYGGSCLTKDLRTLDHLAGTVGVDAPLVRGVMASNQSHIDAAFERVRALGVRSVALFGLTFKTGTDDVRESPYLLLARQLHEAGIRVQIFDPVVHPARLHGANLQAIRDALPDFESMLMATPADAMRGADCALIGQPRADMYDAVLSAEPVPVLDLTGALPPVIEEQLRERRDADGASLLTGLAW